MDYNVIVAATKHNSSGMQKINGPMKKNIKYKYFDINAINMMIDAPIPTMPGS